jgi:hypothetical protein
MRRALLLRAAALAVLGAVACTNGGGDRVLGITATGEVQGFLVFDSNGSRSADAGDDSLPGVRISLVFPGGDTGLVTTSQSDGRFQFASVPVGVYSLKMDTSGFSDTMQVIRVDSATFTVGPLETVTVNALAGYPQVTVAAARALPAGRRVFIVGTALNTPTLFGDTTAHVADATGTIRLSRLRTTILAGDSVRARGTTARRLGQPTLDDVTSFTIGQGLSPSAVQLTTALAATADGATRDAWLAVVRNATVTDTATVQGNFTLTVNDGSGALKVVLEQAADLAFRVPQLPGQFIPANKFDIVGLLVPTGTGSWNLKPRSAADLVRR